MELEENFLAGVHPSPNGSDAGTRLSDINSLTRLCDLEPIGRQIKLTGNFWIVLFSSLFVTFLAFNEQIHVNLSKL